MLVENPGSVVSSKLCWHVLEPIIMHIFHIWHYVPTYLACRALWQCISVQTRWPKACIILNLCRQPSMHKIKALKLKLFAMRVCHSPQFLWAFGPILNSSAIMQDVFGLGCWPITCKANLTISCCCLTIILLFTSMSLHISADQKKRQYTFKE